MTRAAFAVLLWALPAAAQPGFPPAVDVRVVDCEPATIDEEALLAILRLELATDGVERVRAAGDDGEGASAVVTLEPDCAHVRVLVRIDDLVTRKRVEREIDLADVPARSRARALALGVAELLRASWAELALPDAPSVDAPTALREAILHRVRVGRAGVLDRPGASEPSTPPTAEPSVSPSLDAGLLVRAFPSGGIALLGARLALAIPFAPAPSLRLMVAASFGHGEGLHALGAIESTAVLGTVSLDLVLGGTEASVAAGPSLSVGWARAAGRAHAPHVVARGGDAAIALLGVAAEGRLRVLGPAHVALGLEVGAVVAELHALVDGAPVAGLLGASISAWMGLGATL